MPQPSLISVETYLRGELASDVKHEYRGGYVYAMAGAKTQHNRVAGNFFGSMHRHLGDRPCEPFNPDMKVRVLMPRETRFYYPDGMMVCEPGGPDTSFQERPVVVTQVLSESTRRTDEGEKMEAYLLIPTLRIYLLVETGRPRVTAHRRGDQGFAAELYEGLDAVIGLPEIGTELALSELYARVDFD